MPQAIFSKPAHKPTSAAHKALLAQSEFKDGLDRFLTYRLHVLNKLTDRKTNELYEKSMQLTLSDCRCLAVIGHFYPVSINDLALYANLDKSQASRAAQRLVDEGLIGRQSQEGDSRIVNLVLTKKGQRAYIKVVDIATRRNEDVFAALTPVERALLSGLLDKLIENAQGE